ncbi:unnamed protein product, partial [marine sediment metagenome]
LNQGTTAHIIEEFFLDSDYRKIYICRNCNKIAIYNEKLGRYRCKICMDNVDICAIDSSKTSTYVLQELQMANISIDLKPEPRCYERLEE